MRTIKYDCFPKKKVPNGTHFFNKQDNHVDMQDLDDANRI